MSLYGGAKYIMLATSGAWITSQNTGTRGFQVDFECEDGAITGIIWVTSKSLQMAERQFKSLGVTDDQLLDADYMEHQLPLEIAGRQAKVELHEEEYKGKTTVKVKMIYPVVDDGGTGIGGGVANLFREAKGLPTVEAKPAKKSTGDAPVEDDDIPF